MVIAWDQDWVCLGLTLSEQLSRTAVSCLDREAEITNEMQEVALSDFIEHQLTPTTIIRVTNLKNRSCSGYGSRR